MIEPVISGAGRPASAKASATTRDSRPGGPHRVDRRRVGGERLQDHGLGDVGGPVAVHRAGDLEVRMLGKDLVGTGLLHRHDRRAGDALDEQHAALAVEALGDGLHHVVAPAAVVGIDVDGVGAGDEGGAGDERDAGVVGGLDDVVEAGRRAGDRGDDRAARFDEGADLVDLLADVAVGIGDLEGGRVARLDQAVDQAVQLVGERHPPRVALVGLGVAPLPRLGLRREVVIGRRHQFLRRVDIERLELVRQRAGEIVGGHRRRRRTRPPLRPGW